MNRYRRLCFGLCLTVTLLTSLLGASALAQGPPQPVAQAPTTTVKLQVVLSRYDGDKKISSFPFTLSLVPGQRGSLRSGAEVPVATAPAPGTTLGAPGTPSYNIQSVGSQVDATVNPTPDGKYKLDLTVTDRWFVAGAAGAQGGVPNVPSFRNMNTASQAILSNGETMQFTSSSDKASNETFKIDVTLTVGNK